MYEKTWFDEIITIEFLSFRNQKLPLFSSSTPKIIHRNTQKLIVSISKRQEKRTVVKYFVIRMFK